MGDAQHKVEALLEVETVLLALNLDDGTVEFDSYYTQEQSEGNAEVVILHSTYEDELEDHILELADSLAGIDICKALLSHVVLQPRALSELCNRFMKYYPNLTAYTKEDRQAYENIQALQALLHVYDTDLPTLRKMIYDQYDIEDGFNFTYTVWNIITGAEDKEHVLHTCIIESRNIRQDIGLITVSH